MGQQLEIQALVNRARNGDVQAFGEVYDVFLNKIYRFVWFRVGKTEDTEDLTEHIFLKAFQAIRTYAVRKNVPFEAWLFRIARNTITDYYRTNKSSVPVTDILELEDDKPTPEELTETQLNIETVRETLKKLPATYREIIILKYIDERDNTEISGILDKPIDQIRVLQSRALNALKKLLHHE